MTEVATGCQTPCLWFVAVHVRVSSWGCVVRRLFCVACVLVALLWVASGVVAVLYVDPAFELPWEWRLLREPVWAGLLAAFTLGLIVWKWSAPAGTIWKVAYRCGREDAAREGAVNVIPIQRRSAGALN